MPSIRHLTVADYRETVNASGCLVHEIASAAASQSTASPALALASAWRIELVSLAPGASWRARTPSTIAAVGATGTDELGAAPLSNAPANPTPVTSTPTRVPPNATVHNTGRDAATFLALALEPGQAHGSVAFVGAETRDLVGLYWFLVASHPLRFSINDGPWRMLAALETARIDTRARPISRLTVESAVDASPHPVDPATVLAHLVTASR